MKKYSAQHLLEIPEENQVQIQKRYPLKNLLEETQRKILGESHSEKIKL